MPGHRLARPGPELGARDAEVRVGPGERRLDGGFMSRRRVRRRRRRARHGRRCAPTTRGAGARRRDGLKEGDGGGGAAGAVDGAGWSASALGDEAEALTTCQPRPPPVVGEPAAGVAEEGLHEDAVGGGAVTMTRHDPRMLSAMPGGVLAVPHQGADHHRGDHGLQLAPAKLVPSRAESSASTSQ